MGSSDAPWLVLVPGDPGQRTGGYGYVREIVEGLTELGQPVTVQGLPGRFPRVDPQGQAALHCSLSDLPDGATVILDGLALGGCPEAAEQHCQRLRLVALVHHPLADETGLSESDRKHFLASERRALAAVHRVITTSDSTARELARFDVPAAKISVVPPGVRRPSEGPDTPGLPADGLQILCVAHLSPRKSQHHLVEALSRLGRTGWRCELAGSTERDAEYAGMVKARIRTLEICDQVRVSGELSGPALEQAFGRANLFVLPSQYEGYGMVIDEALAHGLPVIASDGGALADTADRPGCVTYPVGDIDSLAALLQERLRRPELLARQREAALTSAAALRSWAEASRDFLQAVSRDLPAGSGFDSRWLALREPADHAARSPLLTDAAIGWLQTCHRPAIADIGSGTGSNWRYLSRALDGRVSGPVQWYLFEQDAALMAGVTSEQAAPCLRVGRLEADNMDARLPDSLDLVTASALIDLVSRPWLEALAQAISRRNAAVLVVLSYAGQFRLSPAHEMDEAVQHLINQHQHGDKGTGAACGPEASGYLARTLANLGYEVRLEPSPWHLDQRHGELQKALLQGWIEAAKAQVAASRAVDEAPEWLDRWQSVRLRQAEAGRLQIEVEHTDLLALPSG